jgi:hypothetical protein
MPKRKFEANLIFFWEKYDPIVQRWEALSHDASLWDIMLRLGQIVPRCRKPKSKKKL